GHLRGACRFRVGATSASTVSFHGLFYRVRATVSPISTRGLRLLSDQISGSPSRITPSLRTRGDPTMRRCEQHTEGVLLLQYNFSQIFQNPGWFHWACGQILDKLRGLEAPVAELFVDGAGHRSPKSDSPVGHPRLGPSPVLSILPR